MVENIKTSEEEVRSLDKRTEIRISKFFSYILRHGAKKEGITIMADGFVYLEDILKLGECQKAK